MGADGQDSVEIELGSPADVESLRELWLELHHHHARVGPQSGEFTDDETSWRYRSRSYRVWLSDPRSFLLLARRGSNLVGYALVKVFEPDAFELDSWRSPPLAAELETLVVTAADRGAGIGGRLLDRVDGELEQRGIRELVVGLIPGNDAALRLYERRGFAPRWIELVRTTPDPGAGQPR